ncbi:MAG: DNA polymerase III subunit beta [Oscillospiraceae bacterium]|nr:DNA polymerase III subunit beta [Oscillospiraceae bacterium]
MNIICSRDILNEAVTPALYAISTKNTVQALDGFLLIADKDSGILTICGYDLEKGIKVTVSGEGIQIIDGGKININAVRFSSVIRNLPEGNVSIETDDNFSVTIKSNKSEFTIHGMDPESYPLMPELKGEKSFKISRKILKNMIVSTLFSVAANSSRASLNGALFEIKDNRMNVVSTDGNRLSLRRSFEGLTSNSPNPPEPSEESGSPYETNISDENEKSEGFELSFIIPGKSLAELLKLIGDEEEPAEIELTRKHVIVSVDNIIYFSRLIESEFLDYRRAIKTDPRLTVVIDAKSFADSVERAAVLTEDRQRTQLRLSFKKEDVNIENKDNAGILQIKSESSIGKVFDECSIEMDGEDLEIGFNHRFLSDALKAIRGEEKILLKLESPTKSLVILPYNGDNKDIEKTMDTENSKFLYLVLPVRLPASKD